MVGRAWDSDTALRSIAKYPLPAIPSIQGCVIPTVQCTNTRLANNIPCVHQRPLMCPDTRYQYVSQKTPATPASAYLPAYAWIAIAGDNSPGASVASALSVAGRRRGWPLAVGWCRSASLDACPNHQNDFAPLRSSGVICTLLQTCLSGAMASPEIAMALSRGNTKRQLMTAPMQEGTHSDV
jgi:hypothetical protein